MLDLERRLRGKRKLLLTLRTLCAVIVLLNVVYFLRRGEWYSPGVRLPFRANHPYDTDVIPGFDDFDFDGFELPEDGHPIAGLMREADERWLRYEEDRSRSFRETVAKYRRKYGRHPPPGFKEWYVYARERNVYNIDDFEQIMDDLRPFWAIDPKVIRKMAAKLSENEADGVSGVHIRNKKVSFLTNKGWRSEAFAKLVSPFVKYLPDMDIAVNQLDQPRLVVPFEDMQTLLTAELESRQMVPDAVDSFTKGMEFFRAKRKPPGDWDDATNPEWFPYPGKQYMDIAKLACPPESPARNESITIAEADALYKSNLGGLITNFNLSSDLCTVGPAVQDKHGFLYSASSIMASKRLVPIFSECKVSVNNDILFPANMYTLPDKRYVYDGKHDLAWEDKNDTLIWRGVTSGGVQLADNWQSMHRQRLVRLANGTFMSDQEVTILSEALDHKGEYRNFDHFQPSRFATKHFDVGFTEAWGCIPNCDFYNDVWTYKPQISLSEQFKNKYLVDVDGHSFSGRWRAFLQSKSLGIKATIFREWHDSRLFAWRHFMPLDNRYDDLYTIMTYLIGTGRPGFDRNPEDDYANADVYVRKHDFEAKMIAAQSRDWAHRVLRKEDIEIYMFRLLLEYGRIIDDNRDEIGYSGDGSELDEFDSEHPFPEIPARFKWKNTNNTNTNTYEDRPGFDKTKLDDDLV
ncbi:hypothetical protein VTN77DRAFT_9477 [Rasamsonia byssochlamydoides]|uniref:uncharacterized protein n=1 Tax=Rasamsonia byssochlamydoides TaxID=89139 RepID=UPI00374204D1